eukprot:176184_1
MAPQHILLMLCALLMHSAVATKYLLSDTAYSDQASAKAYCQSMNTELASIHNADQLEEAHSLCGTIDTTIGEGCWVGLTRGSGPTDETSTWSWTDGTACDYGCNAADRTATVGLKPWAELEPYQFYDCVNLWPDSGMLLNDLPCSLRNNYALCNPLVAIPAYIYVSTPLSRDEAQTYCEETFTTNLATIISAADRSGAISSTKSISTKSVHVWMGLMINDADRPQFMFSNPSAECPDPPSTYCVDFWREPNADLTDCAAFDVNDNVLNDFECGSTRAFLCDQQNEYVFGSLFPEPGATVTVPDLGHIVLSETLAYMHHAHTIGCNIQFDEDEVVLATSYIEITAQMQAVANVVPGSILPVTGPIFQLLPMNCTRVPAYHVITVDVLSDRVKVYVKEATLWEYIPEMDLTEARYDAFSNNEQVPIKIDQKLFESAENECESGTLSINTLACAVEDEDGNLIEGQTTPPVDGKCNGVSAIDEYGGIFGDGLNNPQDMTRLATLAAQTRRRLGFFDFFRNAFNAVRNFVVKAVKVVVSFVKQAVAEVVRTSKMLVRLVTGFVAGDINERIINAKLTFDDNVQFKIASRVDYNLYKDDTRKKKWGPSITGSIDIEAGVRFSFLYHVDFAAKYKLFQNLIVAKTPQFNYLKLVVGAENDIAAYVNVDVSLVGRVAYQLFYKERHIMIMIARVFPVKFKPYVAVKVGFDISMSLSYSAKAGYEPISLKMGVVYDGSTWEPIFDKKLDFTTFKNYCGIISKSDSCNSIGIE